MSLEHPSIRALLREAGRRAPEVWRRDEPACVEAVCELIDVIGRPLTHSEIGALLGITRQRVQQPARGVVSDELLDALGPWARPHPKHDAEWRARVR